MWSGSEPHSQNYQLKRTQPCWSLQQLTMRLGKWVSITTEPLRVSERKRVRSAGEVERNAPLTFCEVCTFVQHKTLL